MKNVAILVPITANVGFLSQIAAIRRALTQLEWSRWTWPLRVCTGGPFDIDLFDQWRRRFPEVSFTPASNSRFDHEGDWVPPDAPADQRAAPCYLNFGSVFFSASVLQRLLPTYFRMRHALGTTLREPGFSAQLALTLALAEDSVPILELPMRYNFPNDEAAERRYPDELERVVFWHLSTKTEVQLPENIHHAGGIQAPCHAGPRRRKQALSTNRRCHVRRGLALCVREPGFSGVRVMSLRSYCVLPSRRNVRDNVLTHPATTLLAP